MDREQVVVVEPGLVAARAATAAERTDLAVFAYAWGAILVWHTVQGFHVLTSSAPSAAAQ